MKKRLTQKQVALVGEEINNVTEMLIQVSIEDDYEKIGAYRAVISWLSELLTDGYDDWSSFESRFGFIKNYAIDIYVK